MNYNLFWEEKYNVFEKNQDCTSFVFKVLPQYLDLQERKKIKDLIISIKLLSQLNDDNIPNYENKECVYRNIMFIEFIVNDINKVAKYAEILHKLFKAPTIFVIKDNKLNYIYSFSLKRINKLDSNEIVVDEVVNTGIFSEMLNRNIVEEYNNLFNVIKNKNNKYEFYYEIILKTKIFLLKDDLKEKYFELINKQNFYDLEKMKLNYKNLKVFEYYMIKYKMTDDITGKYELKQILEKIDYIF